MVQMNNFQVSLPQSESAQQDIKPNVVSVTVLENGDIIYDKDTIQNQQLAQRVHATLQKDSETVFLLIGDKSTRYERVVNVLELLKKSGIKHVSIATEAKK